VPDFLWSATALRFRDVASGRFVPQAAVRQAVDVVVDKGADRLARLTAQLRAGALDVPTWQAQFAQELKLTHLATATAAKGGVAQMAPADWGRVGQQLRVQYGFLRGFAADVASGKQPLDGRAESRARLYGQAARATYEETRRGIQRERGGQERRVLHSARESCADCVSYAGRGWAPVGSLPAIGESACRSNCRCTLEYRAVRRAA
jgi:hypothetical protein